MAKSYKLDTRSSRRAIPVPSADRPAKLHIEKIVTGLALGYRKGLKGGVWYARRHDTEGGYEFERLGIADDVADADGVKVLTRDQAYARARDWFTDGAGAAKRVYRV